MYVNIINHIELRVNNQCFGSVTGTAFEGRWVRNRIPNADQESGGLNRANKEITQQKKYIH
jgi:hypothetical protein